MGHPTRICTKIKTKHIITICQTCRISKACRRCNLCKVFFHSNSHHSKCKWEAIKINRKSLRNTRSQTKTITNKFLLAWNHYNRWINTTSRKFRLNANRTNNMTTISVDRTTMLVMIATDKDSRDRICLLMIKINNSSRNRFSNICWINWRSLLCNNLQWTKWIRGIMSRNNKIII